MLKQRSKVDWLISAAKAAVKPTTVNTWREKDVTLCPIECESHWTVNIGTHKGRERS